MKNKLTLLGVFFSLILIVCISFRCKDNNSLLREDIDIGEQYSSTDWIYDSIDYVADSTLYPHYIDEKISTMRITDHEIVNMEQLYYIVEPILKRKWGDDAIATQKPFRINRIDSIWIITGTLPRLKSGEDVLGGVFYMEVSTDGILLKSIHSE